MFLSLLKPEEKELFLHLCVHAANANEVFSESEKNLIQTYCTEMGINVPENLAPHEIDQVIEKLNSSSDMRSKKIIILELLGLVLVDKDYDAKEKDFMYQLSNELGLQTDVLEEMSAKLHSYLKLCEELGELVLKLS
ncbi:hypothetical protein [Mediterraneibacter glycyrrhizinilyticus]|uniref:hypothetical protein n=1 Tax=Mediterraneibacter glycyrrhizinilyticus TaxID=342942 RepID=UPI0025A3F855|nr:hypothetical protein [Mediterraneibacter glycyrrhizinilyticus]MDM8209553.1 hypothetical protein [Mediterraneibacter glycyrrhizinilyticus]